MSLFRTFLTMLVLFASIEVPLLAHHSVAREFDQTRATTIQGVITKVEWTNPHAWINMDMKNAGSTTSWRVQIAAVGALKKAGFDRDLIEFTK